MRALFFASAALVSLTVVAPAALAGPDETQALIAECGRPNLPRDAIDSCLERTRVMEETDPAAQLQSLEAQLEQQSRSAGAAQRPYGPPPQENNAPQQPPDGQAAPDDMNGPAAQSPPDDQMPLDEMNGPDGQSPPDEIGAPDDLGPPGDIGPPDEQSPPDEPPVDDSNPGEPPGAAG